MLFHIVNYIILLSLQDVVLLKIRHFGNVTILWLVFKNLVSVNILVIMQM